MGKKKLSLGTRLRYPITIVKLLKSPGEAIARQEPAMQYSFRWMREVGDATRGETWQEEQTTFADWDSPADGTVVEWLLREGDTIHRDSPCLAIDEPCTHEVQFAGMCGICGKDMTVVDWASEQTDAQRATINMTHDQTSLMVATAVAERAEHDAQRRLLAARKLILVVDLDQTIIHACIEPTVGEWQRDPSSPNYEAVRDVRSFQLNDDGPRGLASGCSYYIKTRPGLAEFLASVAELYELHVYTMGTRAYALNIAKIVDPQQKYFGNRLISRDENGSLVHKRLQRLFPVSTDMAVIIDDRADVWPHNRQHLIKVAPFDFFKGIGDINSSFLPRRQDILPDAAMSVPLVAAGGANGVPIAPAPAPAPTAGPVAGAAVPIAPQPLVAVLPKTAPAATAAAAADADDAELDGGDVEMQTQEQERSLEKQITERPLLHMQEQLDREDGQGANDSDHHSRHHLLGDDDDELIHLRDHLTRVHHAFYEAYDRNIQNRASNSVRENGRASGTGDDTSNIDLSLVPDVGPLLDNLKTSVLAGTVIVLSGLVPLGLEVHQSELGLQTVSFGATLHARVTRRTTHLVISTARPRTQKVRQAARLPGVKIVYQGWLADCFSRWEKVDEGPYLVAVHPDDRRGAPAPGTSQDTDAETAEEGAAAGSGASGLRVTVVDEIGRERLVDEETSDDGLEISDEDDDEEEEEGEEAGLEPDEANGLASPIDGLKTFDWGGVDDELAEFLGSDGEEEDYGDDDSDEDEDAEDGEETDGDEEMVDRKDGEGLAVPGSGPGLLAPGLARRKRKALEAEDGVSDDGSSGGEGTGAGRKKKARKGGSLLRDGRAVGDDKATPTPSPAPTPTPGRGEEDEGGGDGDGDADDLEADLMAELEAAELA